MIPKPLHSTETLKEYFCYNPSTGGLIKVKKSSNMCKLGSAVGSLHNSGYLIVTLKGKAMLVHRVCYKIYHGVEPEIVDHINGDKTDNRIENLRSVTYSDNNKNRLRSKGYVRLKSGTFRASIFLDGKNQDVGYYQTEDEARVASKNKRRELGWIK